MEDVAAPALATAKQKAPKVAHFHEAYRKKDGSSRNSGKTKTGKMIEIEVEDGTFVDIEK